MIFNEQVLNYLNFFSHHKGHFKDQDRYIEALKNINDEKVLSKLDKEVLKLTSKYPIYR